ncbi:lipid A export ATP-binding/permease protein MsbA [Candidatus Phycosocius bacilliformis]|uniref:Lipid A export ATP-binding/permease protein MsbA n=1 Tax=Candidatus Phycosocius bacilliformis TaxID=1445552 RepID=A0A2P2E6C0_9PROT|nr:ABC transporter transmembrane domain-containing protein [Candidatus Phycosocius bacilliformis]GBF56614.1 lipid A export ATP-binding/permease protein MsbA [Candidatus Phycosocius bacilliformis]
MTDTPASRAAEDRPSRGALQAELTADAAAKRGRSSDLRPLLRLLPYIQRRKMDLAFAALFLVLAAAATLALPVAARALVDRGFATATPEAVNRWFVLLVGVALCMAIFSASRFYFVTKLGERVVADLRADVYDRLISLSPAYFARVRTGEALSRLTVDATLIESLVGSSASIAVRNLVMLAGGLSMMVVTSLKLTFMVLLIIPIVLIPLFTIGRRVRALSTTAQDRVAEAAAEASESIDAVETVQAFGRETYARDRFRQAVEASFAAARRRIAARSFMTAVAIGIVFCGISFVLWEGTNMVLANTMTPGALTQFVILSVLTGSGVGALAEVWGDVQKAAGATQRLSEILDEVPEIAAPANPVDLPENVPGLVAFKDVVFSYPSDGARSALKGVSFEVKPGQTVAIVGPSGAGKSTLFKLLLRYYDPAAGSIHLDGVDARDTDPHAWRQRFAYVSQNPDLFTGTAMDNILFGQEGAGSDAAEAAARRAEAEPFILSRLGGYDKPIGDRGRALSGGERQRLAIARALVREAPVLLLDEATSALDAENERLVQKAFDEAMANRTTLVIAHRLATVLRADWIIVLEDGQVAEQGTHNDLVAKGGLYARLARLQFETQIEA